MNIIGRRYWWFALSLLIIIPGIVSLFTNGLNRGIDFKGGNILDLKFEKQATVEKIRSNLNKYNLGADAAIQMSEGNKGAVIRTRSISQDTRGKLLDDMQKDFGKVTVVSEDRVDPVVANDLIRNALLALGVASVVIMLYIAFRFSDIKFGIAAIIAVFHDAFVVLGLFSLFQWEVDSSFVAAILTIIGYSIMDTIVIFDRIRENLKRKKKEESFEEVVNNSIVQTLTRSVNTVLMVIFMLAALIAFGGGTTVVFVRALLIGVISGAYSSVFNASPLWVEFKNRIGKSKAAAA